MKPRLCLKWTVNAVVAGILLLNVACGGSKNLAAQIDDLLHTGRVAEANRKLVTELPELVQAGKTTEADEVARVVEKRADELSANDALTIRQNSVESYFEGVNRALSDVPLDDVCEVAVTGRAPPSAASLQEVVQYAQEQHRRESATEFCKLLGLEL